MKRANSGQLEGAKLVGLLPRKDTNAPAQDSQAAENMLLGFLFLYDPRGSCNEKAPLNQKNKKTHYTSSARGTNVDVLFMV